MYLQQNGSRVVVHAPAKVNLSLEILAKRADGYHEIETVMASVSLVDTLEFAPTNDCSISLRCRWAAGLAARQSAEGELFGDLPEGPANIVWRAADLLRERCGTSQGADIRLVKRIPAQAGLGGASSDAAAALLAANRAWGLNWSVQQLAQIAAEIGSDVPFFLGGSVGSTRAAVARGRGERIEPIMARRLHIVLVKPPVGLSTADVYRRCRASNSPRGSRALVAAMETGNAAEIGRHLHNDLERPAAEMTPWIERLRDSFSRMEMHGHQMSGSGSSYFGIARGARHARRMASRLRAGGLGAIAVATMAST